MQFEAQNMIFTPALDVIDQSILARIPFESYYITISTQSKQETLFSMIFQTSSKSKVLFQTSKHIESNTFEGFWIQFQAHDMICISRFMWQIS